MSPLFGGGDREQRDRSEDERERARLEREACRAAREDRAPRALPPQPEGAPSAPDALAPEPEPPVVEPPIASPEPEPVSEPEPDHPRSPEPVGEYEPPQDPHATQAFDRVREPSAFPGPPPDTGEETGPYDPPAVVVRGRPDEPAGLKRVSGSAIASAAGAQGPPRFGAPPRGIPKRRRGTRRLIWLLVLVTVLVLAFFYVRLYQPGADEGKGRVAVTIPAGASASQIGELLAERGVVSSGFFFSLRARLSGENLRSGEVALRRGMSYEAALGVLSKPPPSTPVLDKITLPEGPSRKELSARVKEAGIRGSYVTASRRSGVLDPRDYGAPRAASLEGFLFPATYDVKPRSTARSLVNQQLRAFKREFAQLGLARSRRANLSRYEVVVIASMIEREALVAKDRRLIAGVIYNRLKQGMPLGIDATTRFELENFSRPLKQSELQRDTPYNTRTRQGLPPGPIGNPGAASLRAAANPARNDFVFYVVKPCENGAHAFSASDAQFQRDVAAYNRKRAELGGKDPSQC